MFRRLCLIAALVAATIAAGASAAQAAVPDAVVKQIDAAMPEKAPAKPAQKRKLLVFWLCKGYAHGSIPVGNEAFEMMGQKTGAFEVTLSNDMAVFTPDKLKAFDAILFNNTTRLDFPKKAQREALMDFVKGGKGVIGIHAATDNFYNWPEAAAMMGGLFDGHPWTADGTWAVDIDDPKHPINKPFAGNGFKIRDEIYQMRDPYSRDKLRVLLTLNLADPATASRQGKRDDGDNAISWIREFGKGRVFYCSLGHNSDVFWNKPVLAHYLAGIQYALGDLKADATPSNKLAGATQKDAYQVLLAYKFGVSRAPLVSITTEIRGASKQQLRLIENKLLDALTSPEATFECKQFACRMLRRVGTERSIPALGELLTDEKLSHPARFALQGMPGGRVDDILREALGKTTGKLKIGIVSSIGARRDRKAVSDLTPLAGQKDDALAAAATNALGRIGGPDAADALVSVRPRDKTQAARAYALLACADSLLADDKAKAVALYGGLVADGNPASVQIAALRGLARTDKNKAVPLVATALKGKDLKLRLAAAKLSGELPGEQATKMFAEQLPSLPAETKVAMLVALSARGDKAAADAVARLTKDRDDAVRIAAVHALAMLGDVSHVRMLATFAQAKGPVGEVALDTLGRMRGIDAMILKRVRTENEPLKAILVRTLVVRQTPGAAPALLAAAKDANVSVRIESLKALGALAEEKDLPALIKLLVNAETSREMRTAGKAVLAVCRRVDDVDRPVVLLTPTAANPKTPAKVRHSLLQILGELGGKKALAAVRAALKNPSDKMRDAAVRSLTRWPDDAAAPDLLDLAKNAKKLVTRVLALRGYVRVVGLPSDRSPGDTVKMYEEGMAAAARPEDKRLVLAGMGGVGAPEALAAVDGHLNNASLHDEAAAATVRIAGSIGNSHTADAKAALKKIMKIAKDERTKTRARSMLVDIERLEGFIVTWMASGPYTRKGLAREDLFNIEFAPEKPDGSEVKWIAMPAFTDKARPWLIDINEVFRGENRVAYLRTRVRSPEMQEALIELGSDDGVTVWLNGKLVHANNALRGIELAQDKVKVTLEEGWNSLLVKVTQGPGHWYLCLRLLTPDGMTFPGLTVQAK